MTYPTFSHLYCRKWSLSRHPGLSRISSSNYCSGQIQVRLNQSKISPAGFREEGAARCLLQRLRIYDYAVLWCSPKEAFSLIIGNYGHGIRVTQKYPVSKLWEKGSADNLCQYFCMYYSRAGYLIRIGSGTQSGEKPSSCLNRYHVLPTAVWRFIQQPLTFNVPQSSGVV